MTIATDNSTSGLAERVAYRTQYFEDASEVVRKIISKTVVPYQVEAQPGRLKGKKICWMPCSYCYGASSENTGERLTPERYVDLVRQMAYGPHGRVDKIIYAGYATDPLNYEFIDDLVAASQEVRQIIGVHSKLLRISDRLVRLLTTRSNRDTNYVTVSIDAGSSQSYNATHSIKSTANLYDKVLDNIRTLTASRQARGAKLDVAANYLLTNANSDNDIVEKGIRNLIDAGVDSIRFSFPQLPRGFETVTGTIIPTRKMVETMYLRLKPIIDGFSGERTKVLLMDFDREKNIVERRTLPCFARFIYPAIAYDGYLSHCSQSAAVHFREMALGNLQIRDFWEAYYDYDPTDLHKMLEQQHRKMIKNDCRCDRKEHTVNGIFRDALGSRA